MPSYNSLSREDKFKIKELVKSYIVVKLGSEDRILENTVFARSQGKMFSTYGISESWEDEFKKWFVQELRTVFGLENVPMQSWETLADFF